MAVNILHLISFHFLPCLSSLQPGVTPKQLTEGKETSLFWTQLGGKGDYGSGREARETGRDPKMYQFTGTAAAFKVRDKVTSLGPRLGPSIHFLYPHSLGLPILLSLFSPSFPILSACSLILPIPLPFRPPVSLYQILEVLIQPVDLIVSLDCQSPLPLPSPSLSIPPLPSRFLPTRSWRSPISTKRI